MTSTQVPNTMHTTIEPNNTYSRWFTVDLAYYNRTGMCTFDYDVAKEQQRQLRYEINRRLP